MSCEVGEIQEHAVRIDVKLWSEVPEGQLEDLFLDNPFPFYRGTPLGDDRMKRYMFMLAKENAEINREGAMAATINAKPVVTAQVYEVPYLSTFWNMPIGALGHFITDRPHDEHTYVAASTLVRELLHRAKKDDLAFISTTIPGASIMLIRALEAQSFRYAEGFINMVGPTNRFRDRFNVPGMKIRDFVKEDLSEIAGAYAKVSFPSRYMTDGGFDPKKASELYVNRFSEVHEQELGKVFVAELDGKFAGALIAIIDEKMSQAIGVRSNILSGLGIIVHPRASRRGIATALIEHRQDYYRSEGVEYVNFGANFNNGPMILGLEKLGLRYGSVDMAFHLWR
jgi:GNAT superfamily N-acetyltransferase